jgi:hypothetical protein
MKIGTSRVAWASMAPSLGRWGGREGGEWGEEWRERKVLAGITEAETGGDSQLGLARDQVVEGQH